MKDGKRLLFNQAIVGKLQELITKYPNWRFGQLLYNCEIITSSGADSEGKPIIEDPFYEESEKVWNRMVNNRYCFEDDN